MDIGLIDALSHLFTGGLGAIAAAAAVIFGQKRKDKQLNLDERGIYLRETQELVDRLQSRIECLECRLDELMEELSASRSENAALREQLKHLEEIINARTGQ